MEAGLMAYNVSRHQYDHISRRNDRFRKGSSRAKDELEDWIQGPLWDHAGPGNIFYHNPWNVYSMTQSPTTESVAAQIYWQSVPFLAWGFARLIGAEVAGLVGAYSVPPALGATPMKHLWLFGAVSAFAMVYDVHTDPRKEADLSRGLKISNSSNRDVMKMMTLGPVS